MGATPGAVAGDSAARLEIVPVQWCDKPAAKLQDAVPPGHTVSSGSGVLDCMVMYVP